MPYDKTQQDRRDAHRCIKCGEQDARTLSGKVHCKKCADFISRKNQLKRAELKQAGLCCYCGKPMPEDRIGYCYCMACYKYKHSFAAASRARKKELTKKVTQ